MVQRKQDHTLTRQAATGGAVDRERARREREPHPASMLGKRLPTLPTFSPAPGYNMSSLRAPPQLDGELLFGKHADCSSSFRGGGMQCGIEWDEWAIVGALVTPKHSVLELGMRFGTTSCALSRATKNSGRVVAVDPETYAVKVALGNRARHNCNFAVFGGSVSSQPQLIRQPDGYATRTHGAGDSERNHAVPHVAFRDLERLLGWRFDTLLIDCEGCIGSLLTQRDEEDILSGIRLIILEHDSPQTIDGGYGKYFDLFRRRGFQQIWMSQDTYAPRHPWSRMLKHSAWRRVRDNDGTPLWTASELAIGRRACWKFARRMNYTSDKLLCLDPALDDPVGRLTKLSEHGGLNDRQLEIALKPHRVCTPVNGRQICQLPPGISY